MYSELYSYFIVHKNLNLPGIGNLVLERKPAEADFVNRCIKPPIYTISLQEPQDKASHKFYTWIASAFNISENEAVIKFNDFVFEIKNKIKQGGNIEWKGIGILSKGFGDKINFTAQQITLEQSVPAQKIIREKAEHSVLVGERERTSVEMSEYLNQPDAKRSLWWILPLAILLAALVFVAWHFSNSGMNTSSTSNALKINTGLSNESYRQIR